MPGKRITMHKIRDVIRLRLSAGLSIREISRSTKLSVGGLQKLKRPHMTKQLLWDEYTQNYPNHCYSYSQFCDHFRQWQAKQQCSVRQHHRAGEKCFVDYGGSTVGVINATTGEGMLAAVKEVAEPSGYSYDSRRSSRPRLGWLTSPTYFWFGAVADKS